MFINNIHSVTSVSVSEPRVLTLGNYVRVITIKTSNSEIPITINVFSASVGRVDEIRLHPTNQPELELKDVVLSQ